jgi:hypothetical protein
MEMAINNRTNFFKGTPEDLILFKSTKVAGIAFADGMAGTAVA